MAKYRIRKDHFLHDRERGLPPQFYKASAVIDWPGVPSRHMAPVDDEARAAVAGQQAGRNAASFPTWKGTRPR
jgi:hypothetical protein